MAAVPPVRLRDQLAALSHHHSHPGVRWLPAENLHVTVLFLGDVEEELIDGLTASLRAAAAFTDPFELEILHVRPAPERRPRMLWALVGASEPLLRLSHDLHAAARAAAPGRKSPLRGYGHITLARFRNRPDGLAPMPLELAEPRFAVEQVLLMRSQLLPGGARYHTLAGIPLG